MSSIFICTKCGYSGALGPEHSKCDQKALRFGRVMLRRANGIDEKCRLHLVYDLDAGFDPEKYLIEKDLLADFFDSCVTLAYEVRTDRIKASFVSFRDALARYTELVTNLRLNEDYVHERVFRGEKPWVDGKPSL